MIMPILLATMQVTHMDHGRMFTHRRVSVLHSR